MSPDSATRPYGNADLGVRFDIDDSFADDSFANDSPADGVRRDPAPGLPGNVKSLHLSAHGPGSRQAVLSISRVEAGYETSPRELAEQLVIHNHFAAHTAEQHGWTIHSPWKATMLGGYPAMHCDYVVPDAAPVAEPAPATAGGEPSVPGHVQSWVAYAGRQTYQVTFTVNPPGDLAHNRAAVDTVVRSFEIVGEPTGPTTGP